MLRIKPEELKASILQYAIEGKLVEQRSGEGTAEELYRQIQSKKAKLIKEGKIKKGKPLAEISEKEIPFDIPKSWKWGRLNDIVFNHGQKTPDNVFSYIDIGSIDNVHQRLNDEETLIKAEKAPSRARKIVKFGDILYATVRPYLHNTCIIDREFKAEPIASTGFAVLTCHNGVFNKYLFYYLLSPVFDSYANSTDNAKGMAYPAISDSKLYRGVVPLPPLAEQRRIVAKIEGLLPYVDRYAEAYEELEKFNAKFPEDMKKSILQYAIEGKLVEQRAEEGTAEELYKQIHAEKQKLIKEGKIKKDNPPAEISEDKIPFDIPENWKWVHLNNIATSSLGKTLNKTTDTGEELPYLCSINVYFEGINLDKIKTAKFDLQEKEKYRLQKGDLLICEGGDAGRSAIWDSDEEMYYQNALHRVRFFGNISARYMCFVLECYKKNGIIADYTRGDGIQHLVQSSLYSIWLPLPPLAEQRRIVAKIEELLPLCERLAECREKA